MRSGPLRLAGLLLLGVVACPKSEDPGQKGQGTAGARALEVEAAYEVLESTHDRVATATKVRSILAAVPGDRRALALYGVLEAWADGRLHELAELPPGAWVPRADERVEKPGRAFVHHLSAPFDELGKGEVVAGRHWLPLGVSVQVLELEEGRAKVELEPWIRDVSGSARPGRWSLGEWDRLEDPTETLVSGLMGRGAPSTARPPVSTGRRVGYVPLAALGTSTVTHAWLVAGVENQLGSARDRALRLALYAAREPRDRTRLRELLRVALEAELYSLAALAADDLQLLSDPERPFEWSLTIDHHAFCRGRVERSASEWFDRVPELRPFPSIEYEVKRSSELAGRHLAEPRFDPAAPSHGTDRDLCLVDAVLALGPGGRIRVIGDAFHDARCEVTPVDRDEVLSCVEARLSQLDDEAPPELLAEARRLLDGARQGEVQLQFLAWTWALREFPPDELSELESVLGCLPGPKAERRADEAPAGLVEGDTLEGRTRRWLEETRRRFPRDGVLRLSLTNRRAIPATLGAESLIYRFSGSSCDCEARPTGVEFRRLPPFVVPPRETLDLLLRVPRPDGVGVEIVDGPVRLLGAVEALALPEGGANDESIIRACLSYERGCERPLPESSFARRFAPQRACCCP